MFIRAPSFSKERALDYLISLKIVAKEASHQKSGFYSAVLRAMQEKSYVSNYQFKLYLRALLGDKGDETVLDSMAKVEKAMRASTPRPFHGRGRGRGNRASARCYACGQIGHYQNFCPYKGAPAAKRGKFVPGLQDQSKN